MLLLVLAMADTVSGAAATAVPAAPIAATAAAVIPAPNAVPAIAASPAAMPVSSVPPTADPPAPQSSPPSTPVSPPGTDAPTLVQSYDMAQPRDPWVKLNRGIFAFDIALEKGLLAPVSHGYVHVVPHVVRYHLTSALFNVEEPLTAANDLLQLRIKSAGKALFRFVVNSTFGIAGLFDIAKAEGVPIHISDFGQTLGRYGIKPGPYIVLPVLGPSDLRDGFGRIVDGFADPVSFFIGGITSPEGLSLFLMDGIDWRSRADDTLKAVYGATDPYAFTRSAYTQFRSATVADATGKAAALPDFDAAPATP